MLFKKFLRSLPVRFGTGTKMTLQPNSQIARFLISSPSKLTGTFSTEEIAIDHAFSKNRAQIVSQLHNSSFSRSYYVVSVAHEEPTGTIALPPYLINAELITDLASLWFGKRFNVHGTLQEHGTFWLPPLWNLEPIEHPEAGPFHSQARRDLNIELSWNTFGKPMEFFARYDQDDEDVIVGAFWRAARFYARALRTIDADPEVSFFHLIVAIEMLANGSEFAEDELFDSDTLAILGSVRENLDDGEKVEKFIRSRLYQLRQKVALSAVSLTNERFFEGSEVEQDFGKLTKETLTRRVKAAYDLRGKYAHGGANFGAWLSLFASLGNEIHIGQPVIDDKELKDLVTKTPTWLGLERLVRYMALRFAHTKIGSIHDFLDDD